VYVDELESEIHQFAISLIIASIVMFLAIFSVVFGFIAVLFTNWATIPKRLLSWLIRLEKEGFQDTEMTITRRIAC